MDHWGDPWADDDDNAGAAAPKQDEVTITNKPAYSAEPVLLNNFLDDAQWGDNEDEGFGGWETSIGNTHLVHPTPPETRQIDSNPTLSATELPDTTESHTEDKKRPIAVEDGGWASLEQSEEAFKEVDNVISESSDSATTIRLDLDHPGASPDTSDVPQLDDEVSTRTSTTPSDVSHTEAPPVESPRTSFEDERTGATAFEAGAPIIEEATKKEDVVESAASQAKPIGSQGARDDDFGEFEEDTLEESESEEEEGSQGLQIIPPLHGPITTGMADIEQRTESTSEITQDSGPTDSRIIGSNGMLLWTLENTLLDELFPHPKPSKEPFDGSDEPLSTTSTRKAWYRLTRKSTMREYNTGIEDENYVRVTWANSHIKEEVKKIVHRWTTEHRNSERGHSAGASFYWDQSPSNAPTTHIRKKSIISESSALQLAEENVPPLSTNVPAAFNWSSSPLAVHDPWRQDSPGMGSISSPIGAKPDAIPELRGQESRAVSEDLIPQTSVQLTKLETSTVDTAMTQFKPSMASDLKADLNSLDISPHTFATDAHSDDGDEWGEMVESPTVSTAKPISQSSPNSRSNTTISTSITTPKSFQSSSFQPQASRHASPIVRLRGAVSPTSSAFRFNNFGPVIPASANIEPIGPNLLKPTARTSIQTPMKAVAESASRSQTETSEAQTEPSGSVDSSEYESSMTRPVLSTSDSFTAFESSTPSAARESVLGPVQPVSLPSSPMYDCSNISASVSPAQTPTDPWFSATSKTTSAAHAPQIPTDPWFDTSTSAHTTSISAATEDLWSHTDFSFFESTSLAPLPLTQTPLSPSDPWAMFNTPIAVAPLAQVEARVPTPSPQVSILGGTVSNSEQKRRAEEDEVVRKILEALPDLRYMLR